MTTIDNPAPATAEIDHDKLMAFVFRAVDEVGAGMNAALVMLGDELGYYRSLMEHGPSTAAELAQNTGTEPHYARDWLNAQAAGDYVTYDPGTGRYTLPAEHALALTEPDCPAYLPGLFQTAVGSITDIHAIIEAARHGDGFGWGEHNTDVHLGCERFFRPGYVANLVDSWLPALEGVVEKLESGGTVADIGCGHGASAILMATAFPEARIIGSDYHRASIETARARAEEAGVADRVTFVTDYAQSVAGTGLDLVTTFDCLHDMGDPVGAARNIRDSIADDGTWMIVEPTAGDRPEDNFNPVGRAYYAFSTLLCTPASLSQDIGLGLGAQAGPARIRDVVSAAGFTRFRIAAETPFNKVYEVRP